MGLGTVPRSCLGKPEHRRPLLYQASNLSNPLYNHHLNLSDHWALSAPSPTFSQEVMAQAQLYPSLNQDGFP